MAVGEPGSLRVGCVRVGVGQWSSEWLRCVE